MKESIGGTSLFIIVISFILLFTGIMCLTINHSKAFSVKDDIITMIENNEGIDLNNNSDELGTILSEAGYRTTGDCPYNDDDKYTSYQRDGSMTTGNNEGSVCIEKIDAIGNTEFGDSCYYRVIVFFQLDIPILNSIFNFNLKGDTKIVHGNDCK